MAATRLSDRLTDALSSSGLSPAALAQKAGTTEATISNWINDKVQVEHAKASVLLKVCTVLGVSPYWLLFGDGRRSILSVAEPAPSQTVKLETLTIALQLVDEVLKQQGASLPPPKQAEVASLVYELLEEGMPEAKVLRFARAAAA